MSLNKSAWLADSLVLGMLTLSSHRCSYIINVYTLCMYILCSLKLEIFFMHDFPLVVTAFVPESKHKKWKMFAIKARM